MLISSLLNKKCIQENVHYIFDTREKNFASSDNEYISN